VSLPGRYDQWEVKTGVITATKTKTLRDHLRVFVHIKLFII